MDANLHPSAPGRFPAGLWPWRCLRLVPPMSLALAVGLLLPQAAPAKLAASFTYSPQSPLTKETVTFTSKSTEGAAHSWDLNGDGAFGDATGRSARYSFASPGPHMVTLRVKSGGEQTEAEKTVRVGNRAPSASFSYFPAAPTAGASVSFVSTSSDPDTPIARQAWDLDDDGAFDDGTGERVSRTFPSAGTYTVRLQVTDTGGAASAASQTVAVESPPPVIAHSLDAPPPAAAQPTLVAAPLLLSPFPVVRLRAQLTSTGARVRLLSVRVPNGSRVDVRCRGRACPIARQSVNPASAPAAPASRLVRLRRFQRHLRGRLVLEIWVSKPDRIGKYVRLTIRSRNRSIGRTDACVVPGATRPRSCPST